MITGFKANQTFRIDQKQLLLRLPEDKYTSITIHGTGGGSVAGAVSHWNQISNVGTPFIVDRAGEIFSTYDPDKYWVWHLGIGNSHVDKSCLAIELVNWLGLKRDAKGVICSWPNNYTNPYTGVAFKASFRGFDFWEAYPEAQIQGLAKLCKWLNAKYSIPLKLMGDSFKLYSAEEWPQLLGGINTHTQFRSDKSDVGPAFNWQHFLDAVK